MIYIQVTLNLEKIFTIVGKDNERFKFGYETLDIMKSKY
jgi:hypothetical protein